MSKSCQLQAKRRKQKLDAMEKFVQENVRVVTRYMETRLIENIVLQEGFCNFCNFFSFTTVSDDVSTISLPRRTGSIFFQILRRLSLTSFRYSIYS